MSLALAGVLVVGLLLTGFVAPGFFLRQNHVPTASSSPSSAGSTSADPSPATSSYSRNSPSQLQAARAVTEEFLKRLNADAIDGPDGAKAMACPGSESLLGGTLLAVEAPTQLAIPTQGETRFRDPVIEVDITGVTNQRAVTGYVRLQPWQDHEPCVRILHIH
ncbi:hypothetical protein [Amycolatopsis australiensis]|uniref:hypothetical protein n=1 Tax=Amycolatopsis australiensis TaxID=546364 RepID=UPI000A9129E8|nr:hypothetical protein [Amycolatopsis australiensis]